jgi:cytochrome P450
VNVSEEPMEYPQAKSMSCPFEPPEAYHAADHRPPRRVRLWNGTSAWLVTGHADGMAVLGDSRFSARPELPGYPHVSPALAGWRKSALDAFNNKDNPDHNLQRRMFTRWFTVRHVEGLVQAIQEIVDNAVTQLLSMRPPVDLVENFALPVPSMVIFALLGAPYEDHMRVAAQTNDALSWKSSVEQSLAASAALAEYCRSLIEERRSNSGDDVLSVAIRDHIDGGSCTIEQLVEGSRLMFVAGHETTANMIAAGTVALLENPDQKRTLMGAQSPEAISNAVDELLRYVTIAQAGRCRVALDDVEVSGTLIRAGDGVIVSSESANRDESVFTDPDRLDLERAEASQHASFGHGTHRCLGATLAEVELRIVFRTLFERIPDLTLAEPIENLRFKTDHTIFGLYELPVTWSAAMDSSR